ncbi:MAG: PqqD family protein [Thermodesulfobacteriota bacterium]
MMNDIVVKEENLVSRKIAGETLVVPIRGRLADMQRVFALNPLADFIWERMDGRRTVGEIREAVLAAYEVTPEEAEADIHDFVEDLCRANLASRRALEG